MGLAEPGPGPGQLDGLLVQLADFLDTKHQPRGLYGKSVRDLLENPRPKALAVLDFLDHGLGSPDLLGKVHLGPPELLSATAQAAPERLEILVAPAALDHVELVQLIEKF
jgi:hypothetical protein